MYNSLRSPCRPANGLATAQVVRNSPPAISAVLNDSQCPDSRQLQRQQHPRLLSMGRTSGYTYSGFCRDPLTRCSAERLRTGAEHPSPTGHEKTSALPAAAAKSACAGGGSTIFASLLEGPEVQREVSMKRTGRISGTPSCSARFQRLVELISPNGLHSVCSCSMRRSARSLSPSLPSGQGKIQYSLLLLCLAISAVSALCSALCCDSMTKASEPCRGTDPEQPPAALLLLLAELAGHDDSS